MVGFFDWYYTQIDPTPEADLNAFIERYFVDGKLGFTGGLWYWNDRTRGENYLTIAQSFNQKVTGSGDKLNFCKDVTMVTLMVNGGCNDWVKRVDYYKYFAESALGLGTVKPFMWEGYDSQICPKDDAAAQNKILALCGAINAKYKLTVKSSSITMPVQNQQMTASDIESLPLEYLNAGTSVTYPLKDKDDKTKIDVRKFEDKLVTITYSPTYEEWTAAGQGKAQTYTCPTFKFNRDTEVDIFTSSKSKDNKCTIVQK